MHFEVRVFHNREVNPPRIVASAELTFPILFMARVTLSCSLMNLNLDFPFKAIANLCASRLW